MYFYDKFDKIQNDELMLNVIEKNTGDDKIIPFYYFDIIRKNDNKPFPIYQNALTPKLLCRRHIF